MGGLEDLRHIECQFITEAVDGFYFSLCACGFHFLSQVLHLGVNEIKAVRLVNVVAPYGFCQCHAIDEAVGIADEIIQQVELLAVEVQLVPIYGCFTGVGH